jgi:hypothetical protein
MSPRAVRTGAALVLATGLAAGCESSPRHTPYADNPLLQARQPLLQPAGTPATDAGTQAVQANPRLVVVPPPGLYQQPPSNLASARTTPDQASPSPASPTFSPPAPQTATAIPPAPVPPPESVPAPVPASAIDAPAPVVPASVTAAPAIPPTVRSVEGKYGHAADYTWLQGELDRHYRGHLELRYRAVSDEDPHGGKVRLEDDPRLAEFRPGDIIAVEGELLTEPDGGAGPSWSQYKRFHIRAIRLVERK